MPQFGGKNVKKKTSSSSTKRHFTVVMGNKEHGLYVSSSPSSAARKAVSKLCATDKKKKVKFHIREITQGSKKKTYGLYKGYIEKLKEPIELKGRVIRYKPVAKLSGKTCAKNSGNKSRMIGGEKTREDILRIANEWIGHGTYVLEKDEIIVENPFYTNNDHQYIPYDFLIRFTNYGQFEFEEVKELYKLLYHYCDDRYENKSLTMNCWQFVLLCLLESKYINDKQLEILYHNFNNNSDKEKRIPDYFGKNYSDSKSAILGDIILFQQKKNKIIWHVAILTAINHDGDGDVIEYIGMSGDKVHKNNYIYDEQDNLLFITPENLIEPIVSLTSDGLPIKSATYDNTKLRLFLVNIYFKEEILKYATHQWEQMIERIPSPINYEELYQRLNPENYSFIKKSQADGINYTKGNSNFYKEKSKYLFLKKPEFQYYILKKNNLLHLLDK